MTPSATVSGALPARTYGSKAQLWAKAEALVKRLQMRIAKAIREGKKGKAKALMYLLAKSFYAKLMAVKRVTTSRGSKTAGVDGIIWETNKEKTNAVKSLKRRGYSSQPLRRIHIPKKGNSNKKRPLGIPTMKDRAMQALYLLGLEPIAESTADKNSYGFRPKRSCHDAIGRCFYALRGMSKNSWILEGDIRSCFDEISHEWLEKHIPMDKRILTQWLKTGYIEKNVFHHTIGGTPQGGVISPTLCNMVLDGMEGVVKRVTFGATNIHFVRYADDWVVISPSKRVLEEKVLPAIKEFLYTRGLQIAKEKTRLTKIGDGFDFLGFNVRRYSNGCLLTKPSKVSINGLLGKVRTILRESRGMSAGNMILRLNPVLRGWSNYFRVSAATKTFTNIDHSIFSMVYHWCKRRHPNKGAAFVKRKYYTVINGVDWCFVGQVYNKVGFRTTVVLERLATVRYKRHVPIRPEAQPYDSKYTKYFEERLNCRTRK